MSVHIATVVFDCADPVTLSSFWSSVLDRTVDPEPSPFFASVGTKDGVSPGLFFIKVPEGKAVKNRVHVDLEAADRDAEVTRVLGLGATRVADHDEHGTRWTVLADPEGNEFCIA